MAENWQAYGFPDGITFRTAFVPFIGLVKALNERLKAVGKTEITVPDLFTTIGESALSILRNFDVAFESAVHRNFINEAKTTVLNENTTYSSMYWTWEDLLIAGADGVQNNVILLGANEYQKLTPEWSVKWAMQRYKMLNLLRYVETEIQIEEIYGESSATNTKREAYQDAFNNAGASVNTFPCCSFHGGKGAVKCSATIRQCKKCNPVIPGGAGNIDSWVISFIESYFFSGGINFDPLGENVSYGWNKIKAVSGYFFNSPNPYPYPSGWDNYSGAGYDVGWIFDNNPQHYEEKFYLAYADFNPLFNFKEVQTI